MEILSEAISGWLHTSLIEWVAVLLSLAYLILAMKQNPWCWPCALISTALFTWVFFDVSLIMEAALSVYYMVMAVYGYWAWRRKVNAKALVISTRPKSWHLKAIVVILGLSLVSGFILSKNTEAAWPYVDSLTTWGAVVTTYMVTQKIYENWFYWLVVDSLALALYLERGLYPSSLLMAVYLILVCIGLYQWRRELKQATTDNVQPA